MLGVGCGVGWVLYAEGTAEAGLPGEEGFDLGEGGFDGRFACTGHGADVDLGEEVDVGNGGSEDDFGFIDLQAVFGGGTVDDIEGAGEGFEGLGVTEFADAVDEGFGEVIGEGNVPGLGGGAKGRGEDDGDDGQVWAQGASGGDGDRVKDAAIDEFPGAKVAGGEDAGDGDGGEQRVDERAVGEGDFATALEVGGCEGAGDQEVGEGLLAELGGEPAGGTGEAEQGGAFFGGGAVKLGLVEGGEGVFDLVGGVAEGVEDGNEAAEAGSGDGSDANVFLLEATQDADVGITFCAAAAEGEGDFHGIDE